MQELNIFVRFVPWASVYSVMTSHSPAIAPALSMSPPPYGAWLEAYVRGDRLAFTKLVRQTTPLVMAAALRRCSGRHALAEEAAQAVFVDLAKRAPSLRADATLVAWLHQRATRAAADLMKQEYRRTMREQQAVPPGELYSLNEGAVPDSWLDCREQVNAALSRLKLDEQAALLLRCAEGHDFDAVGSELGCSAEAARKKVSRALEKVRRILAGHRKGISAVVIAHGLAVDQAHAATGAAGAGIDALANHLAGTALAAAGKITVLARAWPWLKALGTGTGAAAAIWVWPIAAASGAFSSKTTAPLTSPVAAVAPAQKGTGFPAVPVQPRIKEGLSVDEIVRGLAAMAEGPRYPDSFIRLEFYRKQLPPDQAGQALTRLKRMVSVSGWHEFLKREWGERFFAMWVVRDGPAALDFAVSDAAGPDFKDAEGWATSTLAANTLYECIESLCGFRLEPGLGHSAGENARILVDWATEKLATPPDAGWTLVQQTLISRGNDLTRAVITTGDGEAMRQLLDVVSQHGFNWVDSCAWAAKSKETLATLMALLPQLDSPERRSKIQFSVLNRLPNWIRRKPCAK